MIGQLPVLAFCAALFAVAAIRPQRGVLIVATLLPLHGLLVLTPLEIDHWKEAAILTLLLACLVARRDPDRVAVVPWLGPLAVLVPLGVISAFVAQDARGLFPVKIAFFYLLFALVAVWFPFDRRDKDHLVTALFGIGWVTASYGLWQQLAGGERLVGMGYRWNQEIRSAGPFLRSIGTFNQPFPFGLFLMMVIVVGVAVALAEPTRLRSRLFLWSLPLLVTAMAFSVVRAALIGTLVGLVVVGVVLHRRLLHRLAVLALVGVGAGIVAAAATGGTALAAFVSDSSLSERGDHWVRHLPRILTSPVGEGLGTTGSAAAKAAEGRAQVGVVYQPDSFYVKVLLELGPLGLALYVTIAALMVVTLRGLVGSGGDALERAVSAGALGMVLAAGTAALFSTYLEIFPMDAFFWLLPVIAGGTTPAARDRLRGTRRARPPRPVTPTTPGPRPQAQCPLPPESSCPLPPAPPTNPPTTPEIRARNAASENREA